MDEDIRAALGRGDHDRAFALLRQHHGSAVFTRSFHILGDHAQAEDALQDTLVAAYRKRVHLATVDSIRAWMMRVGTNKALDILRRDRRQRAKLARQLELDPTSDDRVPSPTDALAGYDRASLDECLATLDPVTRAAFLLRHEDELAWEEISATLGVPVDTIRMRVQRGAVRSLRACLQAKG